jgi:hypothetical protein
MKIHNATGFFDEQNVLDKLTKLGYPLVLIGPFRKYQLFHLILYLSLYNFVHHAMKQNRFHKMKLLLKDLSSIQDRPF